MARRLSCSHVKQHVMEAFVHPVLTHTSIPHPPHLTMSEEGDRYFAGENFTWRKFSIATPTYMENRTPLSSSSSCSPSRSSACPLSLSPTAAAYA